MRSYANAKELQTTYSIGRTCLYEIRKEMEEEVRRGRYPKGTLLDVGGRIRIDRAAFQDYLENRRALKGKNTRKYVPEYFEKSNIRSTL